ncbi:A-kinase anchor protein 17A-like [Limulus polyphemus]|uniref:A-kinase anchor protein 17A-like n=1 Tax=Limulus polyphemus TaxID=6850 RepID=A0ABM1T276_LIMPO|nr:A-kinase anchor protein 17A-like [Limulus polyphemus]XP_022249986.1 A-kinase anchor protein 17A-like [Limulus polyphemus]
MASIQACKDTAEAVELNELLGFFLKPLAKLNICVQLPSLKTPGKSISNWEVMEKLKKMVKPEEFIVLKVSKTTLEFIRFEGEVENKSTLKVVLGRLDGSTIKLSGFADVLKVRAAEAKLTFPARHDWDSFFRDAKNMNEMKPGERPDTIHFQGLPCKWFAENNSDSGKPSDKIIRQVFEAFGEIRCIDIPMLDPYRQDIDKSVGKISTFSFGQDLTFEAYVQYREYMGFVKAMDALRGMKLMFTNENKFYAAVIKVEFDKTKHLSDRQIRKRRLEREKLITLEKEREERVQKERKEEEKRKEEERQKLKKEEEIKDHKLKEKLLKKKERRLLKEQKRKEKLLEKKEKEKAKEYALQQRRELVLQRKEQAVHLLKNLFERIKLLKQREEVKRKMEEIERERICQLELENRRRLEEVKHRLEEEKQQQERLKKREHLLRNKLIKNLKKHEEKKTEEMREKLRKEIAGKRVLKSVLVAAPTSSKSLSSEDLSSSMTGTNFDSFHHNFRSSFNCNRGFYRGAKSYHGLGPFKRSSCYGLRWTLPYPQPFPHMKQQLQNKGTLKSYYKSHCNR